MNTSLGRKPLVKLALAAIIAGVSLNAAALEAQFTNLAPTGANSEFVDPANPHIEVTLTHQSGEIPTVSATQVFPFSPRTFPVTQIGIIYLQDQIDVGPGIVTTYSIDVTALCTEQPGDGIALQFSATSPDVGHEAKVSRFVVCRPN